MRDKRKEGRKGASRPHPSSPSQQTSIIFCSLIDVIPLFAAPKNSGGGGDARAPSVWSGNIVKTTQSEYKKSSVQGGAPVWVS